jgi:hypothetical protein
MILVYRREVCERFSLPEDLKGCENLYLCGISKAYKFLMIDEPGCIVHRQGDNMTGAKSIVSYSRNIAESYERILKNHAQVLRTFPAAVTWYLKKILYRYGVSGDHQNAWRAYCRILHHFPTPRNLVEATALLLLAVGGGAHFEVWRLNRKNKRFGL